MAWTVPIPAVNDQAVGSIVVIYNAGQPDEWHFDLGSMELKSGQNLVPYAAKIKAVHDAYVAQQSTKSPYADMIAAFEAELNKV
jgi:hypothetical protein